MQVSDGALSKLSGNEASSINFRPSPNFKHMKKYLKSKFEEDMNAGLIMPDSKPTQENEVNASVQPPLPPNSPPPDCPLGFAVKQEVEDREYEDGPRAPSPAPERPVMCKDFVRGTCARGAACIYAHRLDLSQLDGVYRFCRDFENKRCVRPVCYFVHATTFEKEHFMRTGTLPPHATAHLRGAAPPPPPPPQPPAHAHAPDMNGDHSPLFANAPAAALASGAGGGSAGGAAPGAGAGALEARLPGAPPALPVATVPSLKRDWRDAFSSPPRDLDANDPLAKKCKRCELTELRLQHTRAQVGGMLRASQELDDKLDKVVKTNSRLHAVLKVLLKPKVPGGGVLQRGLESVGGAFLGGARLAPDADPGKEVLLSQMVLLAKMLMGTDGLPAENGRDLAT